MSVGIIAGNTAAVNVINVSVTGAVVAANSTSELSFTVPNLKTGDYVYVNKPSAQAGLGVVGSRVSAANTLAINYMNNSGGNITPTTETYKLLVVSPEGNAPANGIQS